MHIARYPDYVVTITRNQQTGDVTFGDISTPIITTTTETFELFGTIGDLRTFRVIEMEDGSTKRSERRLHAKAANDLMGILSCVSSWYRRHMK